MHFATRLHLVAALAVLPLAAAMAQPAPTPAVPVAPTATRVEQAPTPPSRANQTIERIRTEDAGTRIDELRVGGETQSITVQPKTGGAAYEVNKGEGARGTAPAAASGDTNGARVWNVLKF